MADIKEVLAGVPLPEPAGFRTRYRSEPGMLGHYPWTYADQRRRRPERPEHESEDLFTTDHLHAYGEACARAALQAERQAIIDAMPGGYSVDPQWVCDFIRERAGLDTRRTAQLPAPAAGDYPVRWPHRYKYLSSMGHVVWRDVFEGRMKCALDDAVKTHKVAVFVCESEAAEYCQHRNALTALNGTCALPAAPQGDGT
jgi:hypothetical protein